MFFHFLESIRYLNNKSKSKQKKWRDIKSRHEIGIFKYHWRSYKEITYSCKQANGLYLITGL